MMGVSLPDYVTLAVPAVGVIVWLVRLEGRLNTVSELVKRQDDDIRYIRERIDEAIDGQRR